MVRVVQFVEGMNMGGIETFAMNLLRNVDRTKVQIDFLILKEQSYAYLPEITSLGSKVYYLLKKNMQTPGNPIARGRLYCELLEEWVENHKSEYDIVHIQASHLQNFYAYYKILKKHDIPMVLHSHNSTHESKYIRIIHKICRSLMKKDKVVRLACSQAAGEWMYGKNCDFKVIPNGIDKAKNTYSEEARERIRQELNIGQSTTVLGHVGRFDEQKNHLYLIDVFNEYLKRDSNAVLVLIGIGKKMDEVKEKCRKLNIENKVLFLGQRSDVNEVLSGFDCLVFPSLYEGLSVVLVEAQANSLPIVASDTISRETIMSDRFELCQIDMTQTAMNLWCDKIEKQVAMGRENYTYDDIFEKYDIRYTVSCISQIYTDIKHGMS